MAEAAQHLSNGLDEEVTEAGVFRLALDGQLRLSVNFVNDVMVKTCSEVAGYWYPDKNYEWISGIFDLPMKFDKRLDIEYIYQNLTGGPTVNLSDFNGVLVQELEGNYYDVRLYQVLSIFDNGNERTYPPAKSLPKNAVLVITKDALQEFQQSKNSTSSANNVSEGDCHDLRELEQSMNGAPPDQEKTLSTTEPQGVTVHLPHMTKTLEAVLKIMRDNWTNPDPRRLPKQINIGHEIDFAMGWKSLKDGKPSRNAAALATAIKPDRTPK